MASSDEGSDRKPEEAGGSGMTVAELRERLEDECDARCADEAYLEFSRDPVVVSLRVLMKRCGL